jgi:hypothetical protein
VSGARISDLAGFLLGTWRLDRDIVDTAGRRLTGHFTGTARFTADHYAAGLLRYLEQGTFQLGSHRGPAFRRLLYHVDGVRARVAFDDGRDFHDLDLREGVCEVEHPCGDDRYHGRFEVDDASRWRQRWTATGPGKHQVIRTVMERAVGRQPGASRCRRRRGCDDGRSPVDVRRATG